jgi:protein TonB
MLLRITLPLALLLSLCLHGTLILPGLWLLLNQARPIAQPNVLEVQLAPPPVAESAPLVSSETHHAESAQPAAQAPTRTRGRQLQRAQSALSKHLLYPAEAIARELEGEVLLLLSLDAEGRITHAEVAKSSGHTILDRAALAAARQLNALPGNPPQTLLPVTFRLD